jgi:hypothetical protein
MINLDEMSKRARKWNWSTFRYGSLLSAGLFPVSTQTRPEPPRELVSGAVGFSVTIEIDAGELVRKTGSNKAVFGFPIPVQTQYLHIEGKATLDGKPLKVANTGDFGRSTWYTEATSSSGKAIVQLDGVIFQRNIHSKSRLTQPASLTPEEYKRYTSPDRPRVLSDNPDMVAKIKSEGLGRRTGETPYEYCVRLAEYMNKRFEYGECDISKQEQKTPAIFNARLMQCQEAAVFAATCIRAVGIPAKVNCGNFFTETGSFRGYHTDLEVFTPEKGWFPFNATRAMSYKGSLTDTVGKDYHSKIANGIGGYLISDFDGFSRTSIPTIQPPLNVPLYDFWAVDSKRKLVTDTGTVSMSTSNLDFDEGLNGAYAPGQVKSEVNMLANSSWNSYSMEGSQGQFSKSTDGTVRFDTYKMGVNPWSSQFSVLVEKAQLKPRQNYELAFWVRADRDKTFGLHSVRLEPPFDQIAMRYHTMDAATEWKRKVVRFTTTQGGTNGVYRLPSFYVGKSLGWLEVKGVTLNELNRN